MAIDDPRVVRACNELARPLADTFARDYWRSKAILAAFAAQGLLALIPPTDDLVADGSPADGRPALTGRQVQALLAGAADIVAWGEATVEIAPGQSLRRIDVIMSIAVNGIPG